MERYVWIFIAESIDKKLNQTDRVVVELTGPWRYSLVWGLDSVVDIKLARGPSKGVKGTIHILSTASDSEICLKRLGESIHRVNFGNPSETQRAGFLASVASAPASAWAVRSRSLQRFMFSVHQELATRDMLVYPFFTHRSVCGSCCPVLGIPLGQGRSAVVKTSMALTSRSLNPDMKPLHLKQLYKLLFTKNSIIWH